MKFGNNHTAGGDEKNVLNSDTRYGHKDNSQHILTVDHPSRISVPVCSMSDAPAAQFIRLLHRHVFPVTAVHHAVRITVTTAGGEHPARETSPVVVHIVQTRALEGAQVTIQGGKCLL